MLSKMEYKVTADDEFFCSALFRFFKNVVDAESIKVFYENAIRNQSEEDFRPAFVLLDWDDICNEFAEKSDSLDYLVIRRFLEEVAAPMSQYLVY